MLALKIMLAVVLLGYLVALWKVSQPVKGNYRNGDPDIRKWRTHLSKELYKARGTLDEIRLRRAGVES